MRPTSSVDTSIERARQIIRNFNRRLDQAALDAPPTKAWVRKALRRQGADRCPTRLRRMSMDVILQYGDALADLFCSFPDSTAFILSYEFALGYRPKGPQGEIVDSVSAFTGNARWTDEWGTVWGHAAGGVGASPVSNPLTDWSNLDEYLARMPDPRAPGRFDSAEREVKLLGRHVYLCGMTHMLAFERLHCLRGMENVFEDFLIEPARVERLLEKLTDYYIEIIRVWGAMGNVDALYLTDDWGTQQSLMISPEMWRRFFARHYARVIQEAHGLDIDVIFHSCGHVTEIIGDLIDLGVDVLDPLQPEAMDLSEVARNFGGKIAFCGGLSDQTMARLTPAQVKDHVRRAIDTLGKAFGNAYIVSPANVLTPEIPMRNIEALFEACHRP